MNAMKVAIEPNHIPPVVHSYLVELIEAEKLENASSLLSDMRMIKSDMELQLARHAGEVANAMMTAGRSAIGTGIAEFEVAIATSQAGTRMAAKLLMHITLMKTCHQTLIFYKLWLLVRQLQKPITAPPLVS